MTNKLGSANPNRIKGFENNNKVENIYNYYKVPGLYETSGQPTSSQLKLLVKKGYEVIINLAQDSIVGKVAFNQESILEESNIRYIHIPVDFDNPKESDFEKFVSIIKKYKNKKLFVHCAANMRVSAFTYRYRRDILNLKHDEIIKDLEKIWKPNKVWKSFLNL
tara:strand:- start:1786 stop:2277 length:492 start_codon:yes stop_codon:yes gene_type:complete